MKYRVSAIAQFDNANLVSRVKSHLIIVNRKHHGVHIGSVIEGVERGARNFITVL